MSVFVSSGFSFFCLFIFLCIFFFLNLVFNGLTMITDVSCCQSGDHCNLMGLRYDRALKMFRNSFVLKMMIKWYRHSSRQLIKLMINLTLSSFDQLVNIIISSFNQNNGYTLCRQLIEFMVNLTFSSCDQVVNIIMSSVYQNNGYNYVDS